MIGWYACNGRQGEMLHTNSPQRFLQCVKAVVRPRLRIIPITAFKRNQKDSFRIRLGTGPRGHVRSLRNTRRRRWFGKWIFLKRQSVKASGQHQPIYFKAIKCLAGSKSHLA